jgi:hypothetical protein
LICFGVSIYGYGVTREMVNMKYIFKTPISFNDLAIYTDNDDELARRKIQSIYKTMFNRYVDIEYIKYRKCVYD